MQPSPHIHAPHGPTDQLVVAYGGGIITPARKSHTAIELLQCEAAVAEMEAMAPTAPAVPAATAAAQPRRVQDLCGATSAKARRLDPGPDSDEEDGRRFLYMDYAVPAPPVHGN
jgi:hypothetical protein